MTLSQPPEIVFLHLPRSDALEAAIRRRIGHLSQYCDDLHRCRVVVTQEERHHQQGRPFEVRIEVGLNGRDLVANRSRQADVYLAVRDAFDDMTRQLEDAVRRRRERAQARDTIRHAVQGLSASGPDFAPASPAQSTAVASSHG